MRTSLLKTRTYTAQPAGFGAKCYPPERRVRASDCLFLSEQTFPRPVGRSCAPEKRKPNVPSGRISLACSVVVFSMRYFVSFFRHCALGVSQK